MATRNLEVTKYYLTQNRVLRYFVQFWSLLLLNGAVFGFTATWLTLPINQPPTQASIADGAFYIMNELIINVAFPFIPLAMFFLVGAVVGRALCGWVCPFGFVQDVLAKIADIWGRILPLRRRHPTKATNESWSDLAKFIAGAYILFSVYLAVTKLIGGSIGVAAANSYGVFATDPVAILDPAATLFVYIPFLLEAEKLPGMTNAANIWGIDFLGNQFFFWFRILSLFIVIILCLFIPRAFCRYLCPTGAIMGKIGQNSLIGVNRNLATCNQCQACEIICPMGVRLLDHGSKLRDSMCINCGDCVDICDTGALSIKLET